MKSRKVTLLMLSLTPLIIELILLVSCDRFDENISRAKLVSEDNDSRTQRIEKKIDERTSRKRTTRQQENRILKRRAPIQEALLPEFSAPIGNVTAVLGRDIRLVCQVENLGNYRVAWLKEETKTIISIDTNIIITNYRIFLIPDEQGKRWALHLKDVQESDRGFYQCQVNTSPTRSISGYLDVVVPPSIVQSQTTQTVEVAEHSNVTVQCQASGHPKPSIVWRRDDGSPIRLNGIFQANERNSPETIKTTTDEPIVTQLYDVKSERLTLNDVDRSMAGIYICTASNGIPTPAIKRIPIYVRFKPRAVIRNNFVSVQLGDKVDIECIVEGSPRPSIRWLRKTSGLEFRNERVRWSMVHQIGNYNGAIYPSRTDTLGLKNSDSEPEDGAHGLGIDQGGSNTVKRHESDRARFSQVTQKPMDNDQPSDQMEVKESALNSYTYKQTLTIHRLQVNDYGEYICVSNNSLGVSETKVILTNPNRQQMSVSRNDHQETLEDNRISRQPQHLPSSRRGSSGRVVYNENYLQAIRSRQGQGRSNSPNKQQQRFSHYDRNSADPFNSKYISPWSIIMPLTIIIYQLFNVTL